MSYICRICDGQARVRVVCGLAGYFLHCLSASMTSPLLATAGWRSFLEFLPGLLEDKKEKQRVQAALDGENVADLSALVDLDGLSRDVLEWVEGCAHAQFKVEKAKLVVFFRSTGHRARPLKPALESHINGFTHARASDFLDFCLNRGLLQESDFYSATGNQGVHSLVRSMTHSKAHRIHSLWSNHQRARKKAAAQDELRALKKRKQGKQAGKVPTQPMTLPPAHLLQRAGSSDALDEEGAADEANAADDGSPWSERRVHSLWSNLSRAKKKTAPLDEPSYLSCLECNVIITSSNDSTLAALLLDTYYLGYVLLFAGRTSATNLAMACSCAFGAALMPRRTIVTEVFDADASASHFDGARVPSARIEESGLGVLTCSDRYRIVPIPITDLWILQHGRTVRPHPLRARGCRAVGHYLISGGLQSWHFHLHGISHVRFGVLRIPPGYQQQHGCVDGQESTAWLLPYVVYPNDRCDKKATLVLDMDGRHLRLFGFLGDCRKSLFSHSVANIPCGSYKLVVEFIPFAFIAFGSWSGPCL